MAVTSYTLPTSAAQAAGGTYPWSDLTNVLLDDGNSAYGAYTTATHSWKSLKLIVGGSSTGTDKGTPTTVVGASPVTKGGSSDVWGCTLTPAIVNNYDFGIEFEVGRQDTGASLSYKIQATNFGFAIPSDATIDGVELKITYTTFAAGGGSTGMMVDSLQLRIYYTWAPKVRATGDGHAFVYSAAMQDREEPQKKFRHIVYDSDRNYVGEWKNVKEQPTFKQDINNLHSSMNIELMQNENVTETTVDTIVTEADESLTTEADEALLADLAAADGLGAGTNVEVNNEVDIIAYYGQFEELLTETDEVMLTENDDIIMIQNGAPEGDTLFTGYIPEYELDFGEGDNITVPLLTHSQELNNIMLETDDTVIFQGPTTKTSNSSYYGIAGAGSTDNTRMAQVFRATSTTPLGRLRLHGLGGWSSYNVPVSISIYNGSDPSAPGSFIVSSNSVIPAHPDDATEEADVDFYFDQFTPVNGNDYIFYIDCEFEKSGGNSTYPANFFYGTPSMSNGSLWIKGNTSNPAWVDMGVDLLFAFYQIGGATTRTFTNLPPENIFKQIIDFARTRGARANYLPESIDSSGTLVTVTFKANTIAEALEAVVKLCPADWYTYYDFGENIIHLHARPDAPEHYYTRGRDVVKLKVKKSIIGLKNDIYFSGGGSPTNLFIRKTDQSKINDYRRGLAKLSDNRVTVQGTAEVLAQAEIDANSDPLYSGTLLVVRVDDFRIEDVTIGEVSGFISFSDIVDVLEMQDVSITYTPDGLAITLNKLLPKVPTRIEDIKRDLSALEQANNPASPTIT